MSERDDLIKKEIVQKVLAEMNCKLTEMHAEHFSISRQAEEDLQAGLIIRVAKIMHPTLFRMFLEYLNEQDMLDPYIKDDNSEELDPCRQSFAKTVTLSVLQQKVPSLIGLIHTTFDTYQNVIMEMVQRMDLAYEDICRDLLQNVHFRTLTGAKTDSGDVHNFGHTTTVLTTDAGKFVYKPHDVRIDLKSKELIDTFFADVMQAPAVCCYDGYGFVEFIDSEPADTEEKARQYCYNLGGLATMVLMLGSSDLHHSNVLSRGIYPVIIDYELMMTPGRPVKENSLGHDLRYSLLYSSLMPQRREEIEMSVLFAKDEKNLSSPLVDGERKCITDYPDAFLEGFRNTYRRCMEQKEELKEFVRSMKGIFVRHIYRNTGAYTILRDKTLEPAWIEDPSLRDEVFQQMSVAMKRSGAVNTDEIAAAETDAILRGDIPYMYIRTDAGDLYMDGRIVHQNFFAQTCIDHVLSRIDNLSDKDLSFEEALLKKAMTRIIRRKHRGYEIRERIIARKTITDEALLSHAETIFREIADDAVYTPSGDICWFGVNYFLETGMELYGQGLIGGITGLAVFFAALHRITSDQEIKKKTEELVEYIMKRIEHSVDGLSGLEVIYPNVESIAMSGGLGGKLIACYLISVYMNNSQYREICTKMIRVLPKMDLRFEKSDVYNGTAGLLKLLCRYDEFFNEPGVKDFCSALADRILADASIPYKDTKIWRTLSNTWAISGAGHGQSGVASALYLAGKRLQREDLITAAQAGFDFEADTYSVRIGAWPDRRRSERADEYLTGYCSGAPGIGMNALLLDYEGHEETLKRAIRSTLKEPLMFKDFLCCGNSAMVEFLLLAGTKLQRPDLVEEARTRMAMIIARAERNGYYQCLNKSMNNVFNASLFYGTAGIGYEMLRLISPDTIECVFL